MNPRELRQQATKVLDEARAVLDAAEGEDRDLTDEERGTYDDLVAQHKATIARAERIEEMDARKVDLSGSVDDDLPRGPITSPKEPRRALTLGEHAQACAFHAYRTKYGMPAVRDKFGSELCREIEHRQTGMSEGTGADGGFLVATEESGDLLQKVHEVGKLANRCRRIQIGEGKNGLAIPYANETSRADGSRWGGIRAYRIEEAGTKTQSQVEFGRWKYDLEKLVVYTVATDELLQDATALGSYLNDVVPKEFAFKIDDEIINGTGAGGQMLGVLTCPALVTQAAEAGQAADTVVYENCLNMWSLMWSGARGNSFWAISQNIEPQLNAMAMAVGTGGAPVYLPAGGLSVTPYATLFGRPVIPLEQCQTLGDLGDILLLDLSQFLMIEKGGIDSASSIHVHFATDETAFRWVMRNNGAPTWNDPLTPFNGGADQSPFVALAAR